MTLIELFLLKDPVLLFNSVCQPPLSTEFSKKAYWSGLPFPIPGDIPDLEIEQGYLSLWADSLPPESLGKPNIYTFISKYIHIFPKLAFQKNHRDNKSQGDDLSLFFYSVSHIVCRLSCFLVNLKSLFTVNQLSLLSGIG